MKRPLTILFALLLPLILAACSPEPEIIVVEITRLVPEIEEVQVTRLVEVEKEVTRIVEAGSGTRLPQIIQQGESDLDFLQLEFWPDFDKPSLLVLLTGELPAGEPLPASVTIPLPEHAEINAVAQIDESGMTSVDYFVSGDSVSFDSNTSRFRVEYYVPYRIDGCNHIIIFDWLAPFTVPELAVTIQEPANAVDLVSIPEAVSVFTDPADGLDYYQLESRVVPRNTVYPIQFTYCMNAPGLTIDELEGAPPDLPGDPLHDQQARDGIITRVRVDD